jgi:hypothetical protein
MRDSNASSPSSSRAGVDCHSVVTLAVRYLISGESKGSSDERKDDSSQARRRRLRGSDSAIASTPACDARPRILKVLRFRAFWPWAFHPTQL